MWTQQESKDLFFFSRLLALFFLVLIKSEIEHATQSILNNFNDLSCNEHQRKFQDADSEDLLFDILVGNDTTRLNPKDSEVNSHKPEPKGGETKSVLTVDNQNT